MRVSTRFPWRCCRVCGCTDLYGCDEGCEWVEADLCSSCVAPRRPARRYRPVRWHPQLLHAFDADHSAIYLPWQPGVLVPRHGTFGRQRQQRAWEREAAAERWESGV